MQWRETLAVLMAFTGGIWLWKARHAPPGELASPRYLSRLSALLRIASLLFGLLWLSLAILRLPYPFELHWTGGAFRDHAERIQEGLPLYPSPGPDWIPFPLPPLYPALCALLLNMAGQASFWPLRLLSLLLTCGSGILLYHLIRNALLIPNPPRVLRALADTESDSLQILESIPGHTPASRHQGALWGVIAVGMFFAVCGRQGVMDMERPEALFLFFLLSGTCLLKKAGRRGSSMPIALMWAFGAGVSFTLASFTRQEGVLFAVAGAFWLAGRRAWAELAFFVMVTATLVGEVTYTLNDMSQGGFLYYALHVYLALPGSREGLHSLLNQLLLAAPLIIVSLLALFYREGTRTTDDSKETPDTTISLCALMLLASGIGLIFGHGFPDSTGAQNILWVFLIAVGCLLPGKSCLRGMNQTPTSLLVFGQMILLLYHPGHLLPTPASAASGRRFAQVVRLLATQGDVLTLDHGGFTQPRRFHRLALEAVLNKEGKIPSALNTALRGRKFVVILSDRYQPDTDALLRLLFRDYAPSESPNIGGPWVVSEPLTPPPGKRVFALRPLSR